MRKRNDYRLTVKACYLGIVSQAVNVNLTAILFTTLGEGFGLSFSQLGSLVFINFSTQVGVALAFGRIVDRYGFRRFITAAHFVAAAGLWLFAASPFLPVPAYFAFALTTFVFSFAAGLMEVLISPVLNAIPSDEKSGAMSVLHSFYCFGQVAVVFGTTLFLQFFGREYWQIVVALWALLPFAGGILFLICPIANAPPPEKQTKLPWRSPVFLSILAIIIFAGAAEITFSQWSSAFLEISIGLPKITGDLLGVGTFALMMGAARISYGVLAKKRPINQGSLMRLGALLVTACYALLAFSHNPVTALLACALAGLGVGLLWPGSISLAVGAFPLAGTWMFAIIAAAGNIGSAAGPQTFGLLADALDLRTAFMITAILPFLCAIFIHIFIRASNSNKK